MVLDPTAPAETIERLSHDDNPKVRAVIAGDPRLSIVRLHQLLAEADTAGFAAANPALPVSTMNQIINDTAAQATASTA